MRVSSLLAFRLELDSCRSEFNIFRLHDQSSGCVLERLFGLGIDLPSWREDDWLAVGALDDVCRWRVEERVDHLSGHHACLAFQLLVLFVFEVRGSRDDAVRVLGDAHAARVHQPRHGRARLRIHPRHLRVADRRLRLVEMTSGLLSGLHKQHNTPYTRDKKIEQKQQTTQT